MHSLRNDCQHCKSVATGTEKSESPMALQITECQPTHPDVTSVSGAMLGFQTEVSLGQTGRTMCETVDKMLLAGNIGAM